MRHKLVAITEKNLNHITYVDFSDSETNECDISKMKKILRMAIANELTEKQRYCLCEHFLYGKSMKNIALDLQVNPSTVTRHIQNAKRRLTRVAKYY